MTVIIGITGPIGCGKSTIGRWLAQRGARVVDADEVARQVVEPGQPALAAVLAAFGDGVRGPGGTLDRAALGEIVFADPAALRRLEAIIHPAVRPRILAAIEAAREAGTEAVVVEAIKLVEGGLADLCDEVWLVRCNSAEQHGRLISRGLGEHDAEVRMATQSGLEARAARVATRVLDTNGSPDATAVAVLSAYEEALAAQRA